MRWQARRVIIQHLGGYRIKQAAGSEREVDDHEEETDSNNAKKRRIEPSMAKGGFCKDSTVTLLKEEGGSNEGERWERKMPEALENREEEKRKIMTKKKQNYLPSSHISQRKGKDYYQRYRLDDVEVSFP